MPITSCSQRKLLDEGDEGVAVVLLETIKSSRRAFFVGT